MWKSDIVTAFVRARLFFYAMIHDESWFIYVKVDIRVRSWYSRAISNFVASSTFILPRTCHLFHHPLRFEEDFQLLLWWHSDFFREIFKLKPWIAWWRSCICYISFDKLHSNKSKHYPFLDKRNENYVKQSPRSNFYILSLNIWSKVYDFLYSFFKEI